MENDKIGALIVYKRDRLARKVTEWIEIYRLLRRKKNIKVVFAENEFPIHYSEMGEINELHFGAMIEQEGEKIVERLIATRITNFLAGKTAGQLPFELLR
ncbi:recombinase family protein [Anaerobacillus sp. HL2]|nr:recombinase family protein [Anaerobacillus sp. HL2]